MEVANLEAAFEKITVTDENDEHISSTATYQKSKVHTTAHSN
jgi:aurora kinase